MVRKLSESLTKYALRNIFLNYVFCIVQCSQWTKLRVLSRNLKCRHIFRKIQGTMWEFFWVSGNQGKFNHSNNDGYTHIWIQAVERFLYRSGFQVTLIVVWNFPISVPGILLILVLIFPGLRSNSEVPKT